MLKKPVSVAIALFASFGAIANAADLSASYERASREFGVPLEIVRAVAYVRSGGVQRQPSTFSDRPPAYGVMGLRDDDWFGHTLRDANWLRGHGQRSCNPRGRASPAMKRGERERGRLTCTG